jgi:hypothetical protein
LDELAETKLLAYLLVRAAVAKSRIKEHFANAE